METRPRWRRRLSVTLNRRILPLVELLTVIALIGIATISYFIVTESGRPQAFLTPPLVAGLLVANLVPAMALMVLVARRVAMRRAARSPIGGRGRLHVRLVAIFSLIAAVTTLMVVVFASLLFQLGVQFWFSDRAKTVLENADRVAQIYAQENKERIERDVTAMGPDVVATVNEVGLESPLFAEFLFQQVVFRDLTEAAIINVGGQGRLNMIASVNLDARPLDKRVTARVLSSLREGEAQVISDAGDRVEAVIRLDPQAEVYLYVSRRVNPSALRQIQEARTAASEYQRTLTRAPTLQFRFNALMLLVSLLIVAVSIWIALTLADRLVRPVGQLVDAARRITAGDLSARVPVAAVRDEVGTLGNAFNRMTRRLEEQTGALVAANQQLDSRRLLIEAVLSGVSAGILSIDQHRVVQLINSSAEALLKIRKEDAVGRRLADLAPELDRHLDSDGREDIIQFASGGEPRTLAVKTVRVGDGHVLTFDDITEQLLDQRRAAWSDVARRIAHEIKNPLTPIQLAAERLQRRYGSEVTSDPATFQQLTGTIVRQVGDLRRMVDEFSSFARMPKPVFREEAVTEIARHALFLHEVAHPDIRFTLDAPEPSPLLVCDRRQLGQALTNIVKNAVEAIQQKREEGRKDEDDAIEMIIRTEAARLCLDVRDTGVGLPAERGRLTEPYMTTRVKGTGLGLAIVKKIVEEHFGSISFEDAPGGGTLVRLVFDSETLARLDGTDISDDIRDKAVNG
ncbi:PAS domain-containing sensor histidine kinase [Sphingomonas parva]|uniref:histidine kinase n=1 Tax=Sphingomonas parva TaxID=2555898 RepID=A0A4Y8ZWD3_9SPHN|nr:PAS domain-containing sensor histidine kinase [Sphingomonas parva]